VFDIPQLVGKTRVTQNIAYPPGEVSMVDVVTDHRWITVLYDGKELPQVGGDYSSSFVLGAEMKSPFGWQVGVGVLVVVADVVGNPRSDAYPRRAATAVNWCE
jgi:hypothetical protein